MGNKVSFVSESDEEDGHDLLSDKVKKEDKKKKSDDGKKEVVIKVPEEKEELLDLTPLCPGALGLIGEFGGTGLQVKLCKALVAENHYKEITGDLMKEKLNKRLENEKIKILSFKDDFSKIELEKVNFLGISQSFLHEKFTRYLYDEMADLNRKKCFALQWVDSDSHGRHPVLVIRVHYSVYLLIDLVPDSKEISQKSIIVPYSKTTKQFFTSCSKDGKDIKIDVLGDPNKKDGRSYLRIPFPSDPKMTFGSYKHLGNSDVFQHMDISAMFPREHHPLVQTKKTEEPCIMSDYVGTDGGGNKYLKYWAVGDPTKALKAMEKNWKGDDEILDEYKKWFILSFSGLGFPYVWRITTADYCFPAYPGNIFNLLIDNETIKYQFCLYNNVDDVKLKNSGYKPHIEFLQEKFKNKEGRATLSEIIKGMIEGGYEFIVPKDQEKEFEKWLNNEKGKKETSKENKSNKLRGLEDFSDDKEEDRWVTLQTSGGVSARVVVDADGGLDSNLVGLVFGASSFFLQDVQSGVFVPCGAVRPGETYLLHTSPLVSDTQPQKTTTSAPKATSASLTVTPSGNLTQSALTTFNQYMGGDSELARFLAENWKDSSDMIKRLGRPINVLEDAGITTWDQLAALDEKAFDALSLPIALKKLLAQKIASRM